MSREELIEKMLDAFGDNDYARAVHHTKKRMAAALDVAIRELLANIRPDEERVFLYASNINEVFGARRDEYLKPKSDPAVEAAGRIMLAEMDHFGCKNRQVIAEVAAKIVAAVRKADAK